MEPTLKQLKEYGKYLAQKEAVDYVKNWLVKNKTDDDKDYTSFVKIVFNGDYEYDDQYSYYYSLSSIDLVYLNELSWSSRDISDWKFIGSLYNSAKELVADLDNYNGLEIVVADVKPPFSIQIL